MKYIRTPTNNVVRIGPVGDYQVFSLGEANELLTVLFRLTYFSTLELEPVQRKLKRTLPCDPRLPEFSLQYERLVRKWISKIERLGCYARDLWWVDIDIGEGYMCWKYPEIRLEYFHYYSEQPTSRQRIDGIVLSSDL